MADQSYVKEIEIDGIHNHQSLALAFQPGLNVLYGKNGTGKTTLLHVLANLCDRDLSRFLHIQFRTIRLKTGTGNEIVLRRTLGQAHDAIDILIDRDVVGTITEDSNELPPRVDGLLASHLGGRPVYLPAFRSVLDAANDRASEYNMGREMPEEEQRAIVVLRDKELARPKQLSRTPRPPMVERERGFHVAYKTILCRRWFGEFVPTVRYPSLTDVNRELSAELDEAYYKLSKTDHEAFNIIVSGVLETVLRPTREVTGDSVESLLVRVKSYLQTLDKARGTTGEQYAAIAALISDSSRLPDELTAKAVLDVYARALETRADQGQKAFAEIRKFEDSINQFLADKKLEIRRPESLRHRRAAAAVVRFPNDRLAPLHVLSSGERQVLTLLFSATHMLSSDGIVLIDEPEISLHTGWQRLILDALAEQAGDRQIIVCTHAPAIASKHRDRFQELLPHAPRGDSTLFPSTEEDDQESAEQEDAK